MKSTQNTSSTQMQALNQTQRQHKSICSMLYISQHVSNCEKKKNRKLSFKMRCAREACNTPFGVFRGMYSIWTKVREFQMNPAGFFSLHKSKTSLTLSAPTINIDNRLTHIYTLYASGFQMFRTLSEKIGD